MVKDTIENFLNSKVRIKVAKLSYVFFEDSDKTDYYINYMGQIQQQVLDNKYDLVVCVAKKGLIVFRSFLKGREDIGFIKTPIINTRTFCNYFETPDSDDKETGSLRKYIKKCRKDIKNFKVLVFDDTLNRGRNAYDCFKLLERREIKAENITYASPTINGAVLDEFSTHKFVVKNENGIYYLYQRANVEESIKEEKLATLFVPKIEYYLDRWDSLGFVNNEEIISRAYQLNQYAHIVGIPYTAYCAYATTDNKEFIDKINSKFLNNAEDNFLKDLGYEKSYVKKLNIKVCNTVGVDAHIIILDFDILTGAYAGIRIFGNPEMGSMTFFPFVSQSPMERADLKDEYRKYSNFFSDSIFENSHLNDINDDSPLWDEQFCFVKSEKNSENTVKENEDKYYRIKCFVEAAARRLINVKTALLLWDFFVKLRKADTVNNGENDKVYDNLFSSLSKCLSRQFFQFDYVEDKDRIKETIREKLKKFYEEKVVGNEFRDWLDFKYPNSIKSLEDLNGMYDLYRFLCHTNDDGKSYEQLDTVVADFKLAKNSNTVDTNIPNKNYLCFCQEFGAFFNNLNNEDTLAHKIPPFPVHKLMQIVVENVTEADFKSFAEDIDIETNRKIFNDCIAAYITVTEDGFGGTVSYMEPDCKSDKLYLVNCCQHGETSNQVNSLYFSDFQCLNECLELSLIKMRMYNGNRENYRKSLTEKIRAEFDKFNEKFGDNKKYARFIKDFKNFDFYVNCAFSEKNEKRVDLEHFPILDAITFVEESEYIQKALYGFEFVTDPNIVDFLNNVIKVRK